MNKTKTEDKGIDTGRKIENKKHEGRVLKRDIKLFACKVVTYVVRVKFLVGSL